MVEEIMLSLHILCAFIYALLAIKAAKVGQKLAKRIFTVVSILWVMSIIADFIVLVSV